MLTSVRLGRSLAVFVPLMVAAVVVAGPAAADSPVGWEQGPDRSAGYLLAGLIGVPLGLAIVIGLVAALLSRRNYVPPIPEAAPAELEHAGHADEHAIAQH